MTFLGVGCERPRERRCTLEGMTSEREHARDANPDVAAIRSEQSQLWNGTAGRAWVDTQDVLDRMFAPFAERLVAAIPERPDGRVLDVGCGTGATTLAIARRLGPRARCVGVDVSGPMIEAAQARAQAEGAAVTFIHADAETHELTPASFDVVASRFGVMFFADPVRAFTNLRRASTDGAALRFVAWRSPAENPFMTTAEHAAAPLLPPLPARAPDAPGQFSFADRRRVERILADSGWASVDVQAVDVLCTFPEQDLVRYFTRLGPVGRALANVAEAARGDIIETVRRAFDPFVSGTDVRFVAACWMVAAEASATPSSRR